MKDLISASIAQQRMRHQATLERHPAHNLSVSKLHKNDEVPHGILNAIGGLFALRSINTGSPYYQYIRGTRPTMFSVVQRCSEDERPGFSPSASAINLIHVA